MAAQRVVGEPAQVIVCSGPVGGALVFGAELLRAGREVGVDDPDDGVPADMPGDELAVGGVEQSRVEASRAGDRAGPDQLGGPHVLLQRASEQTGVPAGPQAFRRLKRRGLGEDGRRPGQCLVVRGLPGQLLAGHSQHERAQVVVPEERILEPAVRIQDLQQIPVRGIRPAELGAVGQRHAGRVRQRPRRVLTVRAVQPALLLPVPDRGSRDQRQQGTRLIPADPLPVLAIADPRAHHAPRHRVILPRRGSGHRRAPSSRTKVTNGATT
jgi:hypothetical protein